MTGPLHRGVSCKLACSKVEPTHLELVTLREHVLNGGDAVVGDLRDVKEPVHTADVHESAVRLDGLHGAHDHITDVEALELTLGHRPPVAHHEAGALLIDLEELKRELLAHELVAGEAGAEVRRGDEATEVLDLHEHATAVHGDHSADGGHVLGLELAGTLPRGLVLRAGGGGE